MNRDARAEKIEEAAYAVLREKGFKGASMLAVARAARASNETLYNWYGDKVGLFSALVARNADRVRAELAGCGDCAGLAGLVLLGRTLLAMLTGERAVALNRAAAADTTGELGAALARQGRETVLPGITDRLAALQAAGALGPGPAEELAETWLALLVGDLQIRRVIGVLDPPTDEVITARADRAVTGLARLYPAP